MNAAVQSTLLAERARASEAFFPHRAEQIARLCQAMAERFVSGGRLLAYGLTGSALSDVHHVAVEFVHPVIVGKRALPALGLTDPLALELLAEPGDIVMLFGEPADGPELARASGASRRRGCLTVAFAPLGCEWTLEPPSPDPFVRQELVETTYHVLWELVHVFFEHRGRHEQTAGAASFLYPFLAGGETDPEAVVADVRESVLMKAEEVQDLRERTVQGGLGSLSGAAAAMSESFAHRGRLLALGNGGSATDAMDIVADLVGDGRSAIDLSADPAILTAIANDIGTEAIFSRQVIAYGRPGDVLVALSTSGNSVSVIAALEEARRRGLVTVALVGYDGGQVAAAGLADHVIVAPSQHIPRIQEAQATAYHLLVEMVRQPLCPP